MNIDTLVLGDSDFSIITYIGAIKVLKEYNILDNINNFYSSSNSSIIILLLVLGYSIDEMLDIFSKINLKKYINIKEYIFNINNIVNNYSIDNGDDIIKYIKQLLENKNINKNITLKELYILTNKNINILVNNFLLNKNELFNYKNTPDIYIWELFRICLSIPIIISPYKYNNNTYVSNVISDNFPKDYYNLNNTIIIYLNINIKKLECNNIIDYIKLLLINKINNKYNFIKKHNNIYKFNTSINIDYNINKKKIRKLYNYGYKKFKNFIKEKYDR